MHAAFSVLALAAMVGGYVGLAHHHESPPAAFVLGVVAGLLLAVTLV